MVERAGGESHHLMRDKKQWRVTGGECAGLKRGVYGLKSAHLSNTLMDT